MVADLVLDEPAQRALRELMSAEPLDEGLAGAEQLLLNLSRLIKCDLLGVGRCMRRSSAGVRRWSMRRSRALNGVCTRSR